MKSNFFAEQFFDVFSPDEIKLITTALSKLKDAPNSGNSIKAYTNGFGPTDLIFPLIKTKVLNKIETSLGRKINLHTGMMLKESVPWEIHTDYIKGDQDPDLGIIIPLNLEPVHTHTIIFNEPSTNSFQQYISENTKLENNATNLHDTLMSHETIDNLEYVSLAMIAPWVPRSAICWDRKLLHASDNFISAGLQEKTALVLFTKH
jgi:hypothetical protein